MSDATRTDYERLAELDGAQIRHSFKTGGSGMWAVTDRNGFIIVRTALSAAEAARLYCDDKDLVPATPQAILAHLKHGFRPYDALPAFQEGFEAAPGSRSPYEEAGTLGQSVNGQAWDRGANVAMLLRQILAAIKVTPPDDTQPGWLARLLRTGRA